jgi:hypothetical protein
MSWIENNRSASFEHTPIEGLYFLSGNQLANETKADWVRGQKYPRIAFPSGVHCDLWEGRDSPIVHIFGEMDLPLEGTRESAFASASDIAEQCGYCVERAGEDGLRAYGHDTDERVQITYDDEVGRMVDITRIRESAPRRSLLDAKSCERLPELYSGEELGLQAVAQVKFFTPDSNWTWYASEFDGEDIFFGLVVGFEMELGYFSLSELESVRGPLGLPIERDRWFEPRRLGELKQQHEEERRR